MRGMRIRVVCIAIALISTSCVHVGPKSPFAAVTSLDGHERVMWQLVRAGDQEQLRAHMAGAFVQTTPEGVLDRDAVLARYAQMKLESFEMGDAETRPAGEDMVITYTVRLHGTSAGQPLLAEPLRVMTVWQTVKRGWVQIAQSVTPQAR